MSKQLNTNVEQQWDVVVLKKTNKQTNKQTNTGNQTNKQTNMPSNKSGSEQIDKMEKEIAKQKKIPEILKKNIQAARLNKNLTQKQLATQSGVDVKTISMIEAGTAIFNDTEIRKIEKIIGKVQRK